MKKFIITLFFLLFCTTLFAGQITQIVILGDSLSDNGNLYHYLKIIPKSPPYFQGRFTNGPTWAEHVGQYYNDKSGVESQNYAVGGATSILHSIIHDSFIAPITLTGEMYDYLTRSLFTDKSKVLYIIWIGANDYLYEKEPNVDYTATSVVNTISWAVNTLINQGGRHFMIMNLPDLSKTPYGRDSGESDRLHTITKIHNRKLADAMKQLKNNNPDTKFIFVDIYSIFNDILNNTAKFNQQYHQNLKNLTEACWQGSMILKSSNQLNMINADLKKAFTGNKMTLTKNFSTLPMSQTILNSPSLFEAYATGKLHENGVTPCANPSENIFWDHIHPTEAVHQILAEIVKQELTGIDI